jgi:subtilisin family serine protease
LLVGEQSVERMLQNEEGSRGTLVPVTIRCADTARVAAELSALSRTPANVLGDVIEAYLTREDILSLTGHDAIVSIELVEESTQKLVSEGRTVHNAATWIGAGYSGGGVKVGIIDSFVGITGLMGTELPSTIVGRCYQDIGLFTFNVADCERRSNHGTAVAESLVDIAPNVSLYVANPISRVDFITTISWMVAQGVRVINYSMARPWDGPGDGTSPFSDSPLVGVNAAVAGGAVFVTAAGNEAQSTWFGPWKDTDADGFHEFSGLTELNGYRYLLPAGAVIYLQMRWSDSWTHAAIDLDLYLRNAAGNVVARSVDSQDGQPGQVPTERIGYIVPVTGFYDFYVKRFSGPAPTWIQIQDVVGEAILYFTGSGSIGNPAETANAGALAVGAAAWSSPSTIAYFSSLGPTPDGRMKPDIVGTDSGNTVTFGPFRGTSQASPHVAGLAALVAGAFPAYTPQEISAYLKGSAVPRGAPNNTWGYGLARLPESIPEGGTPGRVRNFVATLHGTTLVMSWAAPAEGGPLTTYVLQAALEQSFASVIYQATLGNVTSATVDGVPAGTFYLRIVARNAAGDGLPSDVRVIASGVPTGCTAPPTSPGSFTILKLGGNLVRLSRTTGGASNPASDYVLQAALEPGFTTFVYNQPLGGAATSVETTAPAGTFYVRVVARNTCGDSSPSNVIVLSMP